MSGSIERGTCQICKKENVSLKREYYRYPIQCSCCNSKGSLHFEFVQHCFDCKPKPPVRINAVLSPVEDEDEMTRKLVFLKEKISIDDRGVILSKIYNQIGFITADGEYLAICMRDSGYEIFYGGRWHFFKKGRVESAQFTQDQLARQLKNIATGKLEEIRTTPKSNIMSEKEWEEGLTREARK